jgi:hypothetical protein
VPSNRRTRHQHDARWSRNWSTAAENPENYASETPATPGPIFQRYVEDYADHFEIRSHIRLGGRVTGLAPRANRAAGWTVSIEEEGGGTYKEDFDLVVIGPASFSWRSRSSGSRKQAAGVVQTEATASRSTPARALWRSSSASNVTVCVWALRRFLLSRAPPRRAEACRAGPTSLHRPPCPHCWRSASAARPAPKY